MSSNEHSEPRAAAISRGIVLAAVVAVFWYLFIAHRGELTLESLARRESEFAAFRNEHPAAAYGIAFGVYVVVTGLSLPLAAGLTPLYGWLFGFWRGTILVSFASTSGATAAFLLSRYLLRDAIQRRFGDRLAGFNRALEREGAFYLFTLRLIVAVPFFVINLVMGLTPIRVGTFWWVSQLGMLPATCIYVYAGSAVPTLQQLAERGTSEIYNAKIVVAFVLLGLFPIVARKVMARFRPSRNEPAP